MTSLTDKIREGIRVMKVDIEIFYVGRENHELREQLRACGYGSEAGNALYASFFDEDISELVNPGELPFLVGEQVCILEGGELRDTGLERKVEYGAGSYKFAIYSKGGSEVKRIRHAIPVITTTW